MPTSYSRDGAASGVDVKTPLDARNQLDYVFASHGFHESIRARALNGVEEWGPSDHCRILIEIDEWTLSAGFTQVQARETSTR